MISQLSEPNTATDESKAIRSNVVPAGWKMITLGEACEKPHYGFTASAERHDTGTRFLRITDLREGDLKWSEVPFCNCLESEIDRYQLKTGDLVIARIGATTGKTSLAISPPKAVFASYLIRLRPKADINPFFLYFFTQSSAYWSSINSSKDSNLKGGVNAGVLTRIEIPKPSETEQQKIAAVLWKIQKAVEIEEAIVRNARDLKKSLLRRLFIHGLRGEPLKQTEIGPLPESWKVASIGNLTTLVYRYPTYYNIAYVRHGVPEVRGELLRDNGLINNKPEALRFISEETAAKFPQVRLSCGDIVMSVRGTMGKIGLVEEPLSGAVITANLIRLATNQSVIVPDFFRWALLSDGFQARLDAASSKTTIHTIPAPDLKRLQIPLPEISEQREIAEILQTVDRQIDIHESKKRSLQELFKTMLHKLMTAQIRVNDLDIDTSEVSA